MNPDETPLTAEVLPTQIDEDILTFLKNRFPDTLGFSSNEDSTPSSPTNHIRSLLERVYAGDEFADDRGILRAKLNPGQANSVESAELISPEAQIIAQVRSLINGQIKSREDVSKWAEVIKATGDGDLAYSFGFGVGNDSQLSLLGSVDYHKFIDDMLFSPEMQMEIIEQGREVWGSTLGSPATGHPLFHDLLTNKHLSPEAQMGFFNYTGPGVSAKEEVVRNPHANSVELLESILEGTGEAADELKLEFAFSGRDLTLMPEALGKVLADPILSLIYKVVTEKNDASEMELLELALQSRNSTLYKYVFESTPLLTEAAAKLVAENLCQYDDNAHNKNLSKYPHLTVRRRIAEPESVSI